MGGLRRVTEGIQGGAVRRVALLTHQVPTVVHDALVQVLDLLRERGIELLVPAGEMEKHGALLSAAEHCCRTEREELGEADLCLVLGGDGTVLRALRYTRGLGVPVAGVNLGRVGFFATVPRTRVKEDLGRVLEGEYEPHELLGLSSHLNGLEIQAVNDILVGHGQETGVARLAYEINGVPIFDIACDGLLVSTPAGSTAYNLAVGGPVLGVAMQAYILSFVAPHSLATRSVVADAADVLVVRNRSPYLDAQVVMDGAHVGSLEPLSEIKVTTTPALATLALLPGSSFYSQFRERFIETPPG